MRLDSITPELVELAPRVLQPGRLYVSQKYKVAVHLCCCGCGEKVVTPFSAAEWQIKLTGGRATLHPSIGNWSMTCQSHYWIRNNRVIWSGALTKSRIKAVFERDQRDLKTLHRAAAARQNPSPSQVNLAQATPRTQTLASKLLGWLQSLWRRLLG